MPKPRIDYRRERWDTPDGDFIDVDFCDPADNAEALSLAPHPPLVVLFHGLEGCSTSHYALALMDALRRRRWSGAVAHFRGCGGELNRLPRAYHSGDSAEIDWVLRTLRSRIGPARPLFAVGVSLGGNALLKWAGEQGHQASRWVGACAAISPPQSLQAGAESLSRGFNRIYAENFLVTMRRKSLAMLERHPGLFDRRRVMAARNFFDFDDTVTAPLHGFSGAIDYWTRSSCRRFLGGIEVPSLLIHARNDPFMPATELAGPGDVSRALRLDYCDTGGHVGFADGAPPGRQSWLPNRVLDFFTNG